MKPLVIKGDETTPSLNFDSDSGFMKIQGVAIPEDVRDFYEPIKNWIEEYIKQPKPVTEVIMNFEYLNTAASKMVFDFCERISKLHGMNNCRVHLVWKYIRGDVEMYEFGQEVLEHLDCQTELIAIEEPVK